MEKQIKEIYNEIFSLHFPLLFRRRHHFEGSFTRLKNNGVTDEWLEEHPTIKTLMVNHIIALKRDDTREALETYITLLAELIYLGASIDNEDKVILFGDEVSTYRRHETQMTFNAWFDNYSEIWHSYLRNNEGREHAEHYLMTHLHGFSPNKASPSDKSLVERHLLSNVVNGMVFAILIAAMGDPDKHGKTTGGWGAFKTITKLNELRSKLDSLFNYPDRDLSLLLAGLLEHDSPVGAIRVSHYRDKDEAYFYPKGAKIDENGHGYLDGSEIHDGKYWNMKHILKEVSYHDITVINETLNDSIDNLGAKSLAFITLISQAEYRRFLELFMVYNLLKMRRYE